MERFIGKAEPHLYAVLRIIVGLLFSAHGGQKLFGLFGDKPPVPIGSLMGAGGIIELVGGLLVAAGLLAGFAAFVASGMMAVAYFMAHFPRGFLPIANGGELAVVYCFLFLYIAARGPGIWSVDALIASSKKMLPVATVLLLAGLCVGVGNAGEAETAPAERQDRPRETVLDRRVHIEEAMLDVPQVLRLCDSLKMEKRRINVGDCELHCEVEGQGLPIVLIVSLYRHSYAVGRGLLRLPRLHSRGFPWQPDTVRRSLCAAG